MQTMRIAFFLYEGLTTLDIIGPHDVLSRLPDAEAISVGKTTGLVKLGARLVKSRRKVGLATLAAAASA